jgi:hypothetical protein
MLQNSFIHIQSIGAITEKRHWDSGIRDWDSISIDLPIHSYDYFKVCVYWIYETFKSRNKPKITV